MKTVGYSGIPLRKKLGIKEGQSVGFVDIKVCAVDEVWSCLELVVRKELR